MTGKLTVSDDYDDTIHHSFSTRMDAVQAGMDMAVTAGIDATPVNLKAKVYSKPTLKQIGCLSTLILGMSGAGIDSVARREF